MSQVHDFAGFVRMNGYRLTLSQMLQTHFSAEYRKLISLLRDEHWNIKVQLNRKEPGQNLYTFAEPERNGQMRLVA